MTENLEAPTLASLTGAVLAGGRARRFGADKALARVADRTLLERVLASLASAHERMVVGREDALVPGVRPVADLRPGLGPLAGLHAALSAGRTEWLALAACDLPCLTPRYWERLCREGGGHQVVIVRDENGRLEPLAALYRRDILPIVEARLFAGQLRLHDLIAELDVAVLPLRELQQEAGARVLHNVNRPDDLTGSRDPCSG